MKLEIPLEVIWEGIAKYKHVLKEEDQWLTRKIAYDLEHCYVAYKKEKAKIYFFVRDTYSVRTCLERKYEIIDGFWNCEPFLFVEAETVQKGYEILRHIHELMTA